MKLKTKSVDKVELSSVHGGEVFETGGQYFMKLRPVAFGEACNVVYLSDGMPAVLAGNLLVKLIKGSFVEADDV